jgi:voltage-gated potassium channel
MGSPAEATGRRTRHAVLVLGRSIVTIALMVWIYYAAPLQGSFHGRIVVWLILGLAGLGIALAWQMRAIVRSPFPRARAVEVFTVLLPAMLLLYAGVYSEISFNAPASFTEVLGRTDALYFTMTVFSTVGFGDITPVTEPARIVTVTQMVVGLVAIGVIGKLLLGAVRRADEGNARRTDHSPPA